MTGENWCVGVGRVRFVERDTSRAEVWECGRCRGEVEGSELQ